MKIMSVILMGALLLAGCSPDANNEPMQKPQAGSSGKMYESDPTEVLSLAEMKKEKDKQKAENQK